MKSTFTDHQKLTRATVNRLFQEFQDLVGAAFRAQPSTLPAGYPRDYVPNATWVNGLERLIDEEAASERQHRKFAPDGYRHTYAIRDAALLLVVYGIGQGATRTSAPTALDVMSGKPSRIKAEALGYALRELLPAVWVERAASLDYAETVNRNIFHERRTQAVRA